MTPESIKFNFSNEVSDFAGSLGRMTPDKYHYIPDVGDTVHIKFDYFWIGINSGSITQILNVEFRDALKILETLAEIGHGLSEAQVSYLRQIFDYVDSKISLPGTACTVSFNVPLSIEEAKYLSINPEKHISDSTVNLGRIKANLSKSPDGLLTLTGLLTCYLNGDSVVSTKRIDDFMKSHATQSAVEGVAWSDKILTPRLLEKFNAELDQFGCQEDADYHPGSGKVVRDIVHPSLYCYVDGVSEMIKPLDGDFAKALTNKKKGKDFWGREHEESPFQWLPSEFHVSAKGKVRINSYVNNLDRECYPGIYSGLERMFEKILPMFEAVCGSLRNDFFGDHEWGNKRKIDPNRISLRNRNLQVIPKIVEYRVNAKANFDGVWHVEGMSHENILATGLCIVQRDKNFSGAEIEFRRFLFCDEGEELMMATPQNAYSQIDRMAGGFVRPLGRLKTPARRAMVFPNSHIHRLSSMFSSDGNDAVRRIVVFWLVNPERPIISTAHVAPQQGYMSLENAKRYRLALMAERKFHKEHYSEREISLCEH